MDRPTRDQLQQARHEVDMILDAARSGHYVKIDAPRVEALERLLAATAEPTEQELRTEAAQRFHPAPTSEDEWITNLQHDAYAAGACREGAQ